MEMFRSVEEPPEPLFGGSRQYFSAIENPPVSPRQLAQDDPRRSNLAVPQPRPPNYYRPPVPSNLSISTRRPYGSIGASTTQSSPSSLRAQIPPPPPGPHPLANVELPPGSLARRAHIRGYQGSRLAGQPATTLKFFWTAIHSLAFLSQPAGCRRGGPANKRLVLPLFSAQRVPASFSADYAAASAVLEWQSSRRQFRQLVLELGQQDRQQEPIRARLLGSANKKGEHGPHFLNPTETVEQENEDDLDPREDDRKRKRLQ